MCTELDRLYQRRARLLAVIRSLKAYQRVALRGLPASSRCRPGGAPPALWLSDAARAGIYGPAGPGGGVPPGP